VEGNRNVIVADTWNMRIPKITPRTGLCVHSAGTGDGDGEHRDGEGDPVPSAQFNYPRGVAVDQNGNIIVGDTQNHCIRRLLASDDVTPLAVLNLHLVLDQLYCCRGIRQRDSARKYLCNATKDVVIASALMEKKDNNNVTGECCIRASNISFANISLPVSHGVLTN
jgi:DNA-binding beta-propeller fold protein YncE